MSNDEHSTDPLAALDKEVKKLKRISSEWVAQRHDLVEDRLLTVYQEIPALSQSTFDACEAWADASARLLAAQKGQPT